MNTIDLHLHTNCSDGALNPFKIIDAAKENRVNVISITDHDTIDAYTDELFDYADKNGIELIPGVEISTHLKKVGFHVLGYNINLQDKDLKTQLNLLKNNRHDYLYHVSEKLRSLGYIVDLDELSKIDTVTKAHIAGNIVNNKKNERLLIAHFHHIPPMGEFIEAVMNEGCPAYVEKASLTPTEASNLIKKAGGKVVLAHPVCYKFEDNVNENEIKQLVKDMNADGIEAVYIYIDRHQNKINEINHWRQFAGENELFITMGSDFHCFDHIHPAIGLINENTEMNAEEIRQIIDNIRR